MERKDFIRTCGFACLGGMGITALLESCSTLKIGSGTIQGDDFVVPITDFETIGGGKKYFKKYVVLNQEQLKYPICVYRFDDKNYSALWMACTHLGAELQVFGDKLQCPAHGSEFNNKGMMQNGPADSNLRSFPVTIEEHQIKISLKAIG